MFPAVPRSLTSLPAPVRCEDCVEGRAVFVVFIWFAPNLDGVYRLLVPAHLNELPLGLLLCPIGIKKGRGGQQSSRRGGRKKSKTLVCLALPCFQCNLLWHRVTFAVMSRLEHAAQQRRMHLDNRAKRRPQSRGASEKGMRLLGQCRRRPNKAVSIAPAHQPNGGSTRPQLRW